MQYRSVLLGATLLAAATVRMQAQSLPPGGVQMYDASKEKWIPVDSSGVEQQPITGEPGQKGPYRFNIRLPANYTGKAHRHPDTRSYTIISGTWYVGFGDTYDESKLVGLGPGSHYNEPGGIPHFIATKGEPATVQVSGMGPSVTTFTGK